MNRLWALFLGLLLLWIGAAQGVSPLCCCSQEVNDLMECADGHCESRHEGFSCSKGLQCSHNANKECLFLGCDQKTKLIGFVSFETTLSESVLLTATSTPLDFTKSTQPFSTIYSKVNSNHIKVIDVLLQTCSFLS